MALLSPFQLRAPFLLFILLGGTLVSSVDAMETYRPGLQPIQIRKSPQTDPAATVQPLTTPQSKCHDPEEDWKPNADYVKTIAETFCSDEKVEHGVVKPGESVNIKLNDTSAKLIHSLSISWVSGCALKSQICDSGSEHDGCKHWVNEILQECENRGGNITWECLIHDHRMNQMG